MLRKEQNDLLSKTGPGTLMGQIFRLSWQPALLAKELPENECPPVRVKLLGERLLAWRDTQGHYSLMDEFCAHRGVSLWFGRNEHNGLRCPYHGWKYDVTGQCVEIPSEPEQSDFHRTIKLQSYPLIERGSVLWTYMGPPEHQPGRRNTSSRWCQPIAPIPPKGCRSAIGCRRWKAASTQATSHGCIATHSIPTR